MVNLYALTLGEQTAIIFHVSLWNIQIHSFLSFSFIYNKNFIEWLAMNCQVEKCFALSASSRLIACACSKGTVQLFTPETLDYAGTIQFSDAKSSNTENHSHSAELKNIESPPGIFPDAVACQFSTSEKLGECSRTLK